MPDSRSAGDRALADSKEKTTAQSSHATATLAPVQEHARPSDAEATEAARDSVRHTIAVENQTPQRASFNFWMPWRKKSPQ